MLTQHEVEQQIDSMCENGPYVSVRFYAQRLGDHIPRVGKSQMLHLQKHSQDIRILHVHRDVDRVYLVKRMGRVHLAPRTSF